MASAVILDPYTGRPVVDRDLRERLEARDRGDIAELLELARTRSSLVGAERNPPLYMDVNNAYSGDELGLPWRDVVSEGIVAAGDLAVTGQAGANSVNIAAGAAWVLGDTSPALQPNYRVYNDAVVNLGISPDPSNPRRVLIVAQITDQGFAGTGRNWALQALHGTPAASPTLPATPASAIPLANVLVPAAAANSGVYTFTDLRTRAALGGQFGTPAARVFHNAAQSIVTNTATMLAFNSERWDTDAMHDTATNNTRLTFRTAGKYLVGANVSFAANATGQRIVQIVINGSTAIATEQRMANTSGGDTTNITVTTVWDFAVNDFLELSVRQDSGAGLNIVVNSAYSPEFWAHRLT